MRMKTQFSNRILSLVLALVMVMGMLPMNILTTSAANYVDGDACESTTGCSGTYINGFCSVCDGYQPAEFYEDSNVYRIYNAGQLYWFADFVNSSSDNRYANARLMSDIVVNDQVLDADGNLVANASALRAWTPIASTGDSYHGYFQGAYHSISGLYCVQTGTGATAGLFASMMEAVVESVSVLDSWFEASSGSTGEEDYHFNTAAGAIAAYAQGSNIRYCYSEAAVKAGTYAGGIVGNTLFGYVLGCGNGGTVTGTYHYSRVGGIIGGAGGTYGSDNAVVVEKCWNNGAVRNTDAAPKCVGAIVGIPEYASVYNCCYDESKSSKAFGTTKDLTTGIAYSNFKQENVAGKTSAEFVNGTVCGALGNHQCTKWGYTSESHKRVCVLCSATVEEDSGIHRIVGSFNCTTGGYCDVCGYLFEPNTPHYFTTDSPSDCIRCNFTCYDHVIGNDGICVSCAQAMIPVTDIQLARHAASANAIQGENISLSGVTVLPTGASFQTVKWYTVSGSTETLIEGDSISASQAGTLTLRAKIENGTAVGTAFTKDFTFTVEVFETNYNIAEGAVTITKSDDAKIQIVQGGNTVIVPKDQPVRIYGETNSANYVLVKDGASVNLILDNCTVTSNNSNSSPISITSGSAANITLVGENAVTGSWYCAGIFVGEGASLTIGGAGSLTATGGAKGDGAGIGGSSGNSGAITINSGTVTAVSYGRAAAIGAAVGGTPDTITINGGIVTATNHTLDNEGAAGIGSYAGSGGTVIINGGMVTATGGNGGAGIGCGKRGTAPNVTITGGTVRATGTGLACGIGYGWIGTAGTTTITGGNVYAVGASAYGNIGGLSGVSLNTITLRGETEDAVAGAVAEITGADSYGLTDVAPIDGKLYLYLPTGTQPTAAKVDGVVYSGTVTDGAGTFYYEHICAATQTTATCITFAVCDVCGVNVGVLDPNNHESEVYRYAVNGKEPLLLHDVYYTCCDDLKETAVHVKSNGVCSACGYNDPAELNGDIYEIYSVGHLCWFAQQVNSGETNINGRLMNDIDASEAAFPMIGTESSPFQGTFDGNGNTLTLNISGGNRTGFVSYASGATIINLTLEGTLTSSGQYSGSFIGQTVNGSSNTIENCVSNMTLTFTRTGDGTHGGFVGLNQATSLTIKNCAFTGKFVSTVSHSNGGFVGWTTNANGCTIENCYIAADFTGHTSTTKCETFSRNPDNVTVTNSYYLNTLGGTDEGIVAMAAQFASGEVTYLLNGSESNDSVVWKQTLTGENKQDYPQFTGDIVYYDSTNGYNNHVHSWEYKKDGDNKITAICTADDCTNTDDGSVTISAPTDLIYDGSSKDATLTYENWVPDEPTITYSSTDRANVTGSDITASVTLGDVTVTVTYQVTAASISGATVTVNGSFTYTGSEIKPADITVTLGEKTLTVDTDYTVSYSNNTVAGTATVTVTGKGNYTDTATGTFVITDETKPTGEILIKNNGWKQFWNWITFGLFCKDTVDVTVTADGTGSDVAKVEYLFSATVLAEDSIPAEGWTEVSANNGKYTFSIQPQNKGAVYVRITDKGGNVTVINSDGIVVYEDSKAGTTNVAYTYAENSDKDVLVTFNGNTVKSIACGSAALTADTDYTVDYTNGKIVLKGSYLDTLNAGDYTFTVSYDPMGVANSSVTDLANTTFTVKVDKAEIGSVAVDVTAPVADAAKQTTVTGGTGYSAAISWNCDTEKFGYNTAYTATVTLTADGNHKFASGLTVDGWTVESNTGSDATLTKTFAATRKEMLAAISAPANTTLSKYYTNVADAIKELPTTVTYTTESGNVTANIEWACNNYDYAVTKTNTFTWKVKDGELDNYNVNGIATTGEITVTNASAIAVNNKGESKSTTYNGSEYNVAGMFTLDGNAGEASYAIVGGTGTGELNGSDLKITKAGTFQIKLTTAANGAYAAGEATATLTVNKGVGTGSVAIEGWTYGNDATAPVVNSSTNGTAGVTYLYESTDGKDYSGSTAPTNAGSYKLTVTFAQTDLYAACTDDATFTIEQKELTPAISGSITKVYDNSTAVPENNSLAIELDGVVGADEVQANASYAYDGINVGTTKINATGITLGGADAGNYKLTATSVSADIGEITKATPQYVVPTGLTATYGDTLADVTLPNGFTWEDALTTAVGNVGNREFTVTYTPDDTTNFNTVTGIAVSIEVKAAAASVATAPTAISGLIYNKTAQALITAGTANGGEMQYSLSKDSGYSTTIPTGTGADTYTVWYKVVGDSNHSDTAPVSIEIKIDKADPAIGTVTAGVVNDTLETSAIVLNRSNTAVNGALSVDAGQELKLGDNQIAYTFTPEDPNNYKTVTGKVTVTVKDTVAPTGKVYFDERNGWESFVHTITFGLFYRNEVTVKAEANDSFSGIDSIKYAVSDKAMTLEEVKAIADWKVMPENGVGVTVEDAKKFVFFVRITDKAGNVTYLSTDGAEYDTTAPVISGVEDGKTYYTTQKVTVTEKNVESITVNGESATTEITLGGNVDKTYTIVIKDKAGNETKVTVTMKLISELSKPIDELNKYDVNSGDEGTVDGVKAAVAAVDTTNATEAEKEALKAITDKAAELEKVIDDTKAEIARINEELSKYSDATVNSDDAAALEQLGKDIKALTDGNNLTDAERSALTEAATKVAQMLKIIEDTAAENKRISDAVDGYDLTTVTSDDKDDLEQLLADIEKQLESTNLTEEEISELNGDKKAVEDLLTKIEGTDELIDKLIEDVDGYSDDTVKSTDKDAIEQIIEDIDTLLDTENLTEDEKKALEDAKEKAKELLDTIEDATTAPDTDNTQKVEDVTAENVTPDDKTDLEKAKDDLEKALEEYGDNYTDSEKKAIEDELKRIDDALEVIGNVEAVEDLIDKLPEDITKNDEAAIKAADDAYNALSDYEKSLVDADAKKALDDAKAALAELNKPADTTSPNTGDNSNMFLWIALLFISGGAVITLTVVDRKKRMASKR